MLLVLASTFSGCTLTPNVDKRKAGQKWYYYGELLSFYRDETRGGPVELVWLEQVQFTRVKPSEFQKTVRTWLTNGYRKIGFVSVRSQFFVDPYSARKLAADKGARVVVGCWFSVRGARESNTVEYWYQLLDKVGQPTPPPAPSVLPVTQPRPGAY